MLRMTLRISPSGLLFFYLSLLYGALCIAPVSAQSTGQITVTVTNQTTGETLAGREVVLQRHQNEEEQAQVVARGVTDREGMYTFSRLTLDGAHYAVMTRFQEVDYATEHLVLENGIERHEAVLTVYETTAQDTDILTEAHHMIVDVTPNLFDITVILVVQNNGARTYVPAGAPQAGLRLPLPADAFQIQPMSSRIVSSPQGLVYTGPVLPGPAQIIYTYSLDRRRVDNVISDRMAYDTGRIQVLITPSTLTVNGANVSPEGTRQIGERNYLLLSNSSGLQRGMSFQLEFPVEMAWQDMAKWGILGLVIILVLAGVSVPILFKKKSGSRRRRSQAERAQAGDRMDQIIRDMAGLDDQYEAGKIEEEVYHRRRRELKNRAVRLRMGEMDDE